MYLEHFGLNEAPFKITPHTEFFFAGANRGETLEALIYAITSGEGMVKVTGEVGSGKTMLCRVLMERLPKTVETIYLAVPSLSRDEMLAVIAGDLGLDVQGGNTNKLVRALQERLIEIHGEGKQVVALIDEAHAMPLETLEEIRLLSNLETSHDKLMQIVLFGQPELDQHLSLPNMRQLKERITHSFNLLPMPPLAIRAYLDFRLRAAGYKGPDLFGADALKLIAEASEGLTRRINIYADKTLLAAYAADTHTVTPDHVRAAISDTQIVLPASARRGPPKWAVALVSVVIGGAIGFVLGRQTAPETVAPVVRAAAPAPQVTPATPPVEAVPLPATTSIKTEAAATAPPAVEKADTKTVTGKITGTLATAPAATVVAAKTPKDWLAARMEADVQRLEALPGDRYAIQLMTADQREKAAIENFLRTASKDLNPDRIMVYPSGTGDNPKVSVLYSNFPERADANGELAQLPAKLTQFRPYVRSIRAIRDDIRPVN
ncbi:MAG: AAA family ATPase [Betaproteobacteria bacterium]|nr:AAA family ATPase [Betaproteobacteria bacterium]